MWEGLPALLLKGELALLGLISTLIEEVRRSIPIVDMARRAWNSITSSRRAVGSRLGPPFLETTPRRRDIRRGYLDMSFRIPWY
eukprot:111621-Amorphochlora_amoeboformis.AAC.2